MRILLILPAAEAFRVRQPGDLVPRRRMLRFSLLSLSMVAACTPPRHQVQLCDENVEAVNLDADVDVVGISFMTALAPRAYELAAAFRARGRIVVAGGYHPTLCPDEVAQHFDAVVVGEAELLWPRVLEDIEAGRLQRIYRAIELCNLRNLPWPRRDLLERTARYYITTQAVQTGRGCIHGCRYCSIAAFFGPQRRNRPIEEVLAELRSLERDLIFVDDNIVADPQYAKTLFRAMIPLKKCWVSQSSIRIADDPELLSLARQAGCRGLFIGLETLSARNLRNMNKQFTDPDGYAQRIAAIHRQGIAIVAGIMVGLDDDDVEVFQRTLAFLQRCGVAAVQVNILTPLPGTPLFESFHRAGRILSYDWSLYDFAHVVIRPAWMSPQELQDGADWLYAQFYRLDRILWRTARLALEVGLLPAWLALRLNLTYRRDVRSLKILGRNPAEKQRRSSPEQYDWHKLATIVRSFVAG